jgi:hypothetical protein
MHTHPHIHRHGAGAGIASRPASAFHPSSHPSSPRVVREKIVTQLEHDQLTPHGLMVHDHHPADPDRQNQLATCVGLIIISDGIDSSTPAGRMMIGVPGSLAEYERELTKGGERC